MASSCKSDLGIPTVPPVISVAVAVMEEFLRLRQVLTLSKASLAEEAWRGQPSPRFLRGEAQLYRAALSVIRRWLTEMPDADGQAVAPGTLESVAKTVRSRTDIRQVSPSEQIVAADAVMVRSIPSRVSVAATIVEDFLRVRPHVLSAEEGPENVDDDAAEADDGQSAVQESIRADELGLYQAALRVVTTWLLETSTENHPEMVWFSDGQVAVFFEDEADEVIRVRYDHGPEPDTEEDTDDGEDWYGGDGGDPGPKGPTPVTMPNSERAEGER